MIYEIRLSNFYSIREEVVLDLRTGSIRSKTGTNLNENTFTAGAEQLLKSCAIYGANASGKSNLIKAIQFSIRMILDSHAHNENVMFNFMPFKSDSGIDLPSSFAIRFGIDGVEYEYSFSLTRQAIVTEELWYYPNKRRVKIFTRDESAGENKSEIYSFSKVINSPMTVAENTSRKTLFLSRASQMDRNEAKRIYHFFMTDVILGIPDVSHPVLADYTLQMFHSNRGLLLKALQLADSDIIDIQVESVLVGYTQFQLDLTTRENVPTENGYKKQIRFKTVHRSNPSMMFNLETEESDGTKRLFYMLLSMLDVLKNNKAMIVDEIDLHLHPVLTEFLIDLFHKSKSAQLIFSTHNTNLLDLKKLRRDQVWFVYKKDTGTTDLYSLFDFKDFRENMALEKAYLQGRFDAIPLVTKGSAVENLFNE